MRSGHSLRQIALPCSFALCLALSQTRAHGQPSLSVQVPAGCGGKDDFVAALVELRHDETVVENLELAVEIRNTGTEFRLVLTDARGGRQLTDPSCETLFRTAVVIAAASLPAPSAQSESPVAGMGDTTSIANPDADGPSANEAPPEAPAVAASAPPEPRPARVVSIVARDEEVIDSGEQHSVAVGPEFHLGLGAIIGATPKLSAAAEAGGALRLNQWALAALVRYLPEQTTTADASVRMRTEVWGGRLGVGYDITPALRCLVGFTAQRVAAVAVGIRHPEADSVWFLAPELEASVAVARGSGWSADVALQGRIALNTPRFELEPNNAVVFAVPRVGASGFFRLKWVP